MRSSLLRCYLSGSELYQWNEFKCDLIIQMQMDKLKMHELNYWKVTLIQLGRSVFLLMVLRQYLIVQIKRFLWAQKMCDDYIFKNIICALVQKNSQLQRSQNMN
ncbi:unnamed protein product [Paramecium sonneborni]|uniref:Uncharacterized protein n=1 Tax=Paramecium sonneborni TaxID=65129 RepID=A0A8S1PEA4_9CILI|nr:unnamed protein product [Paramecium sonneborni]